MIVEYVRYTIAEERRAAFERAYAEAQHSLDESPFCLAYELARCVEEPSSYVLRIEWTSTDDHIKGFRTSAVFQTFLAAIRPYVGDIAEMRHYEVTAVHGRRPTARVVPTLFEWAGGTPAFERLTTIFYGRVPGDPILSSVFAHMSPEHAHHVGLFLAEVFGGPPTYSTTQGGHRTMVSRHLGRRLTPAQRKRWVDLLVECADEAGLPDDPEFRSAFVAYLEWGSRLALANSQEDTGSNLDQPMPKWGWGETGGPYQG